MDTALNTVTSFEVQALDKHTCIYPKKESCEYLYYSQRYRVPKFMSSSKNANFREIPYKHDKVRLL